MISQNSDTRAKTTNQRVPYRSKHTPRGPTIPTAPRGRTRYKSKPTRRQTTIPSYIVDILVKLG